ncbi:hypothetical protein Prudu_009204 [Prunus dulcis]|uniref:Uncharacterized protein n=1 Tax=Prunus dulcis TaxID=3755 RepID=A0A4Y1R5X6_PRUDU|nr:hypothetical protein Prudu_009204 [Prunus dulcis]
MRLMFKYKIKVSDARRAWMKSPEMLENCSTGKGETIKVAAFLQSRLIELASRTLGTMRSIVLASHRSILLDEIYLYIPVANTGIGSTLRNEEDRWINTNAPIGWCLLARKEDSFNF